MTEADWRATSDVGAMLNLLAERRERVGPDGAEKVVDQPAGMRGLSVAGQTLSQPRGSMASTTGPGIPCLRRILLQDGGGLTDGQLLDRFVADRDEVAFAALVERHGRLVWGVCRRALGPHDAEDAFQATFLVLVRKAVTIRRRERLASWLYGVARQTALRAQRTVARRRGHEKQVADVPEPAAPAERGPWDDVRTLLDRELDRLHDRYRVVVLLCDLQGKTRTEAAGLLGLPEGTVGSRLARARAMLARRLAGHGLAASGGTLAALLSRQAAAAVPTPVACSTLQAAAATAAGRAAPVAASTEVASLTEGALKDMLVNKLKTGGAVAMIPVLVIAAAVIVTGHLAARNAGPPVAEARTAGRDPGRPVTATAVGHPRGDTPVTAVGRDRLLVTFEEHDANVTTVAFSPDGKLVASRGENIRVWEADTRRERHVIGTVAKGGALAFSADGKRLVVFDAGRIVTYDVGSGRREASVAVEPGAGLRAVTLSRDGTRLAAGEEDRIHVWDTATGGKPLTTNATAWPGRVKKGSAATYFQLALSHDGGRVASALGGLSGLTDGQDLKLWDANTGDGRTTVASGGSLDGLCEPVLSPDGKLVATCKPLAPLHQRGVAVHDATSGREVVRLDAANYPYDFGPRGRFLAAVVDKERMWAPSVCLYDMGTKSPVLKFNVGNRGPWMLRVSPDGSRLLTTYVNVIKVWDLEGEGR